jgi:hypothetical protein
MSTSLLLAGIISLTAPGGTSVHVLRDAIFSVRPAVQGDHPSAKTVIHSAHNQSQAVREPLDEVLTMLRVGRCSNTEGQ